MLCSITKQEAVIQTFYNYDWLIGWLIDQLVDWSIDRLIDWLIKLIDQPMFYNVVECIHMYM